MMFNIEKIFYRYWANIWQKFLKVHLSVYYDSVRLLPPQVFKLNCFPSKNKTKFHPPLDNPRIDQGANLVMCGQ